MIAWESSKNFSNQQHSFLKTKHFNKWSHYILSSIILCSIDNSSLWLNHLWTISSRIIKALFLLILQIQLFILSYHFAYWNILESMLYENINTLCLILKLSMNLVKLLCYERIKAEKGWSSNQFAEYVSEYSAYWLKLVSVSSSDLTQSLFSFFNISLFNIIFLSTSHSTHVTNTFSSSLAQSLNIT